LCLKVLEQMLRRCDYSGRLVEWVPEPNPSTWREEPDFSYWPNALCGY
jgi:hypothetical protein